MKIRKGDQVKIISGNDKGKQGKVLVAFPKAGRIIVEGVNIKKKHMRPRQAGKKGEIIRMPALFSMSKAMLICSKCSKPTRVGCRLIEGKKSRICKKCGEET